MDLIVLRLLEIVGTTWIWIDKTAGSFIIQQRGLFKSVVRYGVYSSRQTDFDSDAVASDLPYFHE